MGRNSKARRDAKVKAHRSQEQAKSEGASKVQVRRFPDLSLRPGEPESAIFRRTCTECGAGDLDWMRTPELLERVEDAHRARVLEGIEMLGQTADTWQCPKCGGFGMLTA